ncbi:exodeoxyribonuclease V subunit alpha [Marinobacterium sp. D7]|uniref:exodeoxyribonuclease V subunit alpha n=1 Tax=Marinobacterium ramblicola TaxID=2849041 RepID=UPI001C2CD024|nr:exodeoxyribonuclease V subunit alpha [Marinobacterium ramblicola]MBV1786735.1 exodeoxyribonuclease V subunit alpha [Marinobacterium ramblicola]
MSEQPDLFAVPETQTLHGDRLWQVLEQWQRQGWIRALDLALVRMLAQLDPNAAPELLLAVAMTSHQLGRGHICLDLEATLADPDAALSLPPEGAFGETLPDRPSELLAGLSLPDWLDRIAISALVESSAGAAPLVLEPGTPARLYLRRQWRYEVEVAAAIRERLVKDTAESLPAGMSERLDLLFDTPANGEIDWQRLACALAGSSRFAIITGGPGTGKTTTVVRLLALLQSQALDRGAPLRIRLAAPTGKAAARLTESIGRAVSRLPEGMDRQIPTEVSTLHRLLGSRPDTRHFRHNRDNPLHADLVVIDEASMIDLEMMHALLAALPERAQLILLGDKDQLASVEAGAVLGDLCLDAERGGYSPVTLSRAVGAGAGDLAQWQAAAGGAGEQPLAQHIVMLRKSHRFGEHSGIGRLARGVNNGDLKTVEQTLSGFPDQLALLEPRTEHTPALQELMLGGGRLGREQGAPGYGDYLQQLQAERPSSGDYAETAWQAWARTLLASFTRFRVLCALRKGPWGVEGLNQRIEQVLSDAGLLNPDQLWYEGRPVMLTRNDYSLGLMNGDIGLCLRVPRDDGEMALRVVFPLADGTLKWVLPSRLQSTETVFAMTVHKSQGSEFAHTALVLPPGPNPVLTRELVYTGITRASDWFTLVLPARARLYEAIATRVHRASALRGRIIGNG